MKKVFLFLLFSLIIASCASRGPDLTPTNARYYNLIIDSKFSTSEKELIIRAWKEWENKTNLSLINKIKFDNHIPSLEEYNKNKYNNVVFITFKEEKLFKLGFATWRIERREGYIELYLNNITNIYVEPLVIEEAFIATILHEIGHVLNLRHNEDLKYLTIMRPSVEPEIHEVQCIDIINLCQDPNWNCTTNCTLIEEKKQSIIDSESLCATIEDHVHSSRL